MDVMDHSLFIFTNRPCTQNSLFMNTVNGAQATVYILCAENSCDELSGFGKVHDIPHQ